jgi:hypothetical protein
MPLVTTRTHRNAPGGSYLWKTKLTHPMKPFPDTRTILAIAWSTIAGFILTFIVVVHGDDKALLNLVIGTVSGIIAGILGTYFSLNLHKGDKGSPAAPPEEEDESHAPTI